MGKSGHTSKQSGFVLPYVLVAITILSLIVTIAAKRLQNTSVLIGGMQDAAQGDIALLSAEFEALYEFLTAVPVMGGMARYSVEAEGADFKKPIVKRIGVNRNDSDRVDERIWSSAGETRITRTAYGRVLTRYQDVTGLVSINNFPENLMAKFLQSWGVKSGDARKMAASLADYLDDDQQRRFLGAERADYVLRKLKPPLDSPLRNYAELMNVMHWESALGTFDLHDFIDVTTLADGIGVVKFAHTDTLVLKRLGLNSKSAQSSIGDSGILGVFATDEFPTDRGRFVFQFQTKDGRIRKRVVEFERTINGIYKPFERFWVYEVTMVGDNYKNEFASKNELKNVLYSPSDSPK